MQTFLPYSNFVLSASVLDRQRLGKQRSEGLQILQALIRTTGWSNHSATRMWRGYERALCRYTIDVCDEWIGRGYVDNVKPQIEQMLAEHPWPEIDSPWLGNRVFHMSHQSNLIRKDPEFYGPRFPGIGPGIPYVWPSETSSVG